MKRFASLAFFPVVLFWSGCSRPPATLEQRARCRLAAVHAGDCARQAMDLMYRHGGSTSFRCDSRLAECWRDLHVVGQTVTIAPEWYPIGGRAFPLEAIVSGPQRRASSSRIAAASSGNIIS